MARTALLMIHLILSTSLWCQEFIPPRPYGGPEALKRLSFLEMLYPEACLAEGVKGDVILSVPISEDGQAGPAHTLESPAPQLTEEAMRLLGLIRWLPAEYRGAKVAAEGRVRFSFKPGTYRRHVRARGYTFPPPPREPFDTSGVIYDPKALEKAPQPLFPGDCKNLREYFTRHLQYPEMALKRGLSGKVEVSMVIEPSGRSTNIHVQDGVGGGCDEEAVRLVETLRWVPGSREGMYVRSEIKISVTFAFPEEGSYKYFPTHQGRTMQ